MPDDARLGPLARAGPVAAVPSGLRPRSAGAAGGISAPAALGDMGIHNVAMPFVGLRLRAADVGRDRRDAPACKHETFPAWAIAAAIEFPARGDQRRR